MIRTKQFWFTYYKQYSKRTLDRIDTEIREEIEDAENKLAAIKEILKEKK